MSFAGDLLDGWELLYKRTDGVLKTVTEYGGFFKDLSKLEKDYAKSLAKLAAQQKKEFEKEPPHQKEVATTYASWQSALSELEKIAEHHSQLADKIDEQLCKNMANYVKEKVKARKTLEKNGDTLTKEMKTTMDNLQKNRGKYVALSKDADAAEAQHQKAKGDMNMKPAQLAKMAEKSQQAADKAATADQTYQQVLSQTNQKQSEYYTSTMPSLLKEFQQFEEDRLSFVKQNMETFSKFYSDLPNAYNEASQKISAAAQSINIDSDITAYVRENKTNVNPPSNIEYIAYNSETPSTPKTPTANTAAARKPAPTPGASSASASLSSSSSSSKAAPAPGAKPAAGKIGKYKGAENVDILTSKQWGLTSADQGKPGDQLHGILQSQLDELDKAVNIEGKTKDGLENLVRFYASDPVAQKKAEEQLRESERKVQRYQEKRKWVQSQMDQLGSGGVSYDGGSNGDSKSVKVRGLYDYQATCDTELTFREGDILMVTEQDDSGWWYAELNGQCGFVPNNYVEVTE